MSVHQSSPTQHVTAEYFPGDVSGSIQLLVADAGSRRTIQSMLDDYFEVIIDDAVVTADLYLVEDRLLGKYKDEIVTHVNDARPAFCPLVVIQGGERKLTPVLHSEAKGEPPVLIDDVVEAPVDRSQLVRRVHSLLVRRIQSVELHERVTEVEAQAKKLRRYEQAVESSGNGILLIDLAGRIETVNPAFEKLTGYSTEQAVGESPAFLQPDDSETVFTPDFWQTLVDSREWEGELIIELKGGQRRVVSATLTAISTEETIEGFVLMMNDITERIQREQAVADSEAELDLLRQILSRYLRHNLRNELNVIQGYGQMLAEAELSTTEQHQWAEKIVEVSNRLIATSEKALTYSSLIEQNSTVSEFDLSKIVSDEVATLRNTRHEAEFELHLPDSCPFHARQGIEQAICGLIQNAVIHNDAKSPSVTIEIEERDGVRLLIEDNGPGIPQHEVAALETGEETPLSHSQGIGL